MPRRTSSRAFTENDAVRICCKLINGGLTTLPQLARRLETECENPERTKNKAEDALAEAAEALAASDDVFTDAFRIFQIVNGILNVISVAAAAFPNPVLRVASRGAVVARIQVAHVTQRLVAQRAANEERIQQIRNLSQALKRAA